MSHRKRDYFIHYLPVFGCIATGIIYSAIGVIAILSFLKLKEGGADETSLLDFLSDFLLGRILVLIILAGTLCYIIWRFYEAYTDPYGYGSRASGLVKRTGIALSTITDILIAFAAIRFLIEPGHYQPYSTLEEHRNMIHSLLSSFNGPALIIFAGSLVVLTAVIQLIYGFTRGYRERMEVEELNPVMRKLVHLWGLTGYLSRGIILGIMGYFYIKAGLTGESGFVVDTDKAFDFIGKNIGHVYFILVASGTIFYGLFMFALGAVYDIDRH